MPDDVPKVPGAVEEDIDAVLHPVGEAGHPPFFVYIVESPSAPDLYHSRSEGTLLANALRLDGIPCITRTAINPTAFVAALKLGLPEAMKEHPGRHPVLHISAHGGRDGIQLSSGALLGWSDLRALVLPINESLGGVLLLCMSACSGYFACQMAMQAPDEEPRFPYFGVVGHVGEPTWSDTAVGYLAFYHRLVKGATIEEAVNAMKAASGLTGWVSETAAVSHQGYLDHVKEMSAAPATAQRELETVAQQAELPANAKALEEGRRKESSTPDAKVGSEVVEGAHLRDAPANGIKP